MKKILLLSFIIFLQSYYAIAQCDICKQATVEMYNTLKIKNDKEYIETLFSVYESSHESYEATKKKEGFKLILPEYGTAEYKSNKAKFKTLHNKTVNQTDYSFTQNEYLEIFNQTISDEVRMAQLSTLSKCMAYCNGRPYLSIISYSETDAVIMLHLPLHNHNARKKTKVSKIVLSDGLTISEDSNIQGGVIPYGESRTIKLTRTINKPQSISLDLRKENFVFILVPEFSKPKVEPKFEWVWKSTDTNGNIFQYKSQILEIDPIEMSKLGAKTKGLWGGRKKVWYWVPGSINGLVDLNLSADKHRVQDVHFELLNGGIASENHHVVVNNNAFSLQYNLHSSVAEKVKLYYYIHYKTLVLECVENCN